MLSEQVIAEVVAEVSAGQSNPRYVEETVGAFMRRQPIIGNYVASHQRELGVEGVVLILLHAAVLARAVERSAGRKLGQLGARQLDLAARRKQLEPDLAKEEPAVHDYLVANVAEDATLKDAQTRQLGLYLLRVIAFALVD